MAREKNTETRQKILQTAYSMFYERGFDNVTMKELANACGIGQPLLQYYFKKKEELLTYIFFDLHLKTTNFIWTALRDQIDTEQPWESELFASVYYKLLYAVLGYQDERLLILYTNLLFNTEHLKRGTDFVFETDLRYKQKISSEEKLGAYVLNACLAQFVCIYRDSPMIHTLKYWIDSAIEVYCGYRGMTKNQGRNLIAETDRILTDDVIERFYREYRESIQEYIHCE